MIISNVTVTKLAHDDQRYPDSDPKRPFTDVYLCECTSEDGQKGEAAFFVTRPMMQAEVATMFKIFGAAAQRWGDEAKAA